MEIITFRELKESEISFAVSAYEDMAIELTKKTNQFQVLITNRTLEGVFYLIKVGYRNGVKSYAMLSDNSIVGHIVFIPDNILFDTKEKTISLFAAYIEPEYRSATNFNNFITYVSDKIKEQDIQIVNLQLPIRKSSERIIKRYGLENVSYTVCKKL